MLTDLQLSQLLSPYVTGLSGDTLSRLNVYMELVLRWNARTNLTAVRSAEQLAQRQVGESLVAAQFLVPGESLLDFGSGAGFPGIPLALVLPGLRVTLAESQGKKAAFLREAVRTLGLSAEVFSDRVEVMPLMRTFDAVVMRAVDRSTAMVPLAASRVSATGKLIRYLSGAESGSLPGWGSVVEARIPLSDGRIAIARRDSR